VQREVAAGVSGAVCTTVPPGISQDVANAAGVGSPTLADISAAGVSDAAGISAAAAVVGESLAVDGIRASPMSVEREDGVEEESPLSSEGSQVGSEETGISLEQLRVSEEMGVAGVGGAMNDEHKKQLVNLTKTCESHSLRLSVCLSVCLFVCDDI